VGGQGDASRAAAVDPAQGGEWAPGAFIFFPLRPAGADRGPLSSSSKPFPLALTDIPAPLPSNCNTRQTVLEVVDALQRWVGFGPKVMEQLIQLGGGEEADGHSLLGSINYQWSVLHGGEPPSAHEHWYTDLTAALRKLFEGEKFQAAKCIKLPTCARTTVRGAVFFPRPFFSLRSACFFAAGNHFAQHPRPFPYIIPHPQQTQN
jgi:hypothetical protein